MRKLAALVAIVVIVVFLLPAGKYALESTRSRWLQAQQDRPARKLPIRPEDYRKYPRSGFGFILEDGGGGRIDTFAGLAEKPYGLDTTVALSLAPVDLDSVYHKVIDVRFFDLPTPHPRYPRGQRLGANPGVGIRLVVQAGVVRKEISWDSRYLEVGALSDDWKRISDLRRLILRKVESSSEYRALLPRLLTVRLVRA
jgi:hypothetical protein